jgi:hypothetical protein
MCRALFRARLPTASPQIHHDFGSILAFIVNNGVGGGGLADCLGYACGVVFKLSLQTGGKWKYSVVHKSPGRDGGFPNGVIIDDKGNLYGTTQAFGAYGYGVACEITP